MTNFLLTIVLTNWMNVPGDFKRESGTNYVRQQMVVITNLVFEEVTLCTNPTTLKQTEAILTNLPARWEPVPGVIPPPLPGQFSKP